MTMAEVGLVLSPYHRAARTHFMTTNRTKPAPVLSATDAANQALAEAVEFAKPYGNVKTIAEHLTALTGQPVTRQMVGRWLNEDPEKRGVIGNFGMGLALVYVVTKLKDPNAETVWINLDVPKPKKTRKTKTNE